MNNVADRAQSQAPVTIVWRVPDSQTRHRIYLLFCIIAVVSVAAALAIYGWNYYTLALPHRPFSPKHADLRPSGRVGIRLGILGLGFLALIYLYPLRKRWPALGRIGQTKRWLDFHLLLGLTAPLIATFHCAFKVSGFAGMAYWTMIALVASGLVGRYFYAQIPRSIGAAEMSLKEMQDLSTHWREELRTQKVLAPIKLDQLFRFPDSRAVQSMPMLQALVQMVLLDITRTIKIWSLRRRGAGPRGSLFSFGGILSTRRAELERVISLASSQAALAKRILFLSKTHRIFHLWHVIHRPFSLSLAIFVIIHIAVVMSLGYF